MIEPYIDPYRGITTEDVHARRGHLVPSLAAKVYQDEPK